MIEIASAKSAFDLLKSVLELVDRRKTNRRKFFERTCQPIHEGLTPIVKEYYACIHDALHDLERERPDLLSIQRNLEKRRAALIIDKNSIVADAEYHYARSRLGLNDKINQFELPSYKFGYSVYRLFYIGYASALTSFIDTLERVQLERQSPEGTYPQEVIRGLQALAKATLCILEERWSRVAAHYAELKAEVWDY